MDVVGGRQDRLDFRFFIIINYEIIIFNLYQGIFAGTFFFKVIQVSTYFNGNKPDESDCWKIQIEDIGELVVDLMKMNPRTLPSKIEVRPSMPPSK